LSLYRLSWQESFRANHLPPLQKVFQLPKRIDLNDDSPIVDVTPEAESK
jgi:hypothetical protein